MTDSRSTLDDEVDDEPVPDSRETCWFWESHHETCHDHPQERGKGGTRVRVLPGRSPDDYGEDDHQGCCTDHALIVRASQDQINPRRLARQTGSEENMSSDYYAYIAGEIADTGSAAEAAFLEWLNEYTRHEAEPGRTTWDELRAAFMAGRAGMERHPDDPDKAGDEE